MTWTPRSDPISDRLYTDAWNDYRRRLQRFIGVWLGGFLLVAAFIYAFSLAAGPGWLGMIIAACWLVALRSQASACNSSSVRVAAIDFSATPGITGRSRASAFIAACGGCSNPVVSIGTWRFQLKSRRDNDRDPTELPAFETPYRHMFHDLTLVLSRQRRSDRHRFVALAYRYPPSVD